MLNSFGRPNMPPMFSTTLAAGERLHGEAPIRHESSQRLLILIEPDASVREALCILLRNENWEVIAIETEDKLETLMSIRPVSAVISESRLPGITPTALLKVCIKGNVPLIFTGHEQAVQEAVDLVQRGASDFLEKPFPQARLLRLLEKLPEVHNRDRP